MAAALGGALTQPLVVALLERVPWRHTFPIFGSVGVAVGGGVVLRGSATIRTSTAA